MSDGASSTRRGSPGRGGGGIARARSLVPALLGALAAVFAVVNLDEVQVNWILFSSNTPLIVVIVVSLALGAAIGWFGARRRAKR